MTITAEIRLQYALQALEKIGSARGKRMSELRDMAWDALALDSDLMPPEEQAKLPTPFDGFERLTPRADSAQD